jgi:perosamine synthetase
VIPRVRPSYSLAELRAAWRPGRDAVVCFERELADHFGMRHAFVFPYGRSAIHAALRALHLAGEVVQPAYNCAVVAHATVLAGCRPVFVDVEAETPNQDMDQMVDRVGSGTVAVVPTSMFGMTFDAAALCAAIRRRNPNAFILVDCCQCFDARWGDTLLASQGDAAVLAFGIGKPMTTFYGGALLTNRDDLADAFRRYCDRARVTRPPMAAVLRWGYFLSSWIALSAPVAPLTDILENAQTPLHRYLLRLRAREAIQLPADNDALMMPMEAAVGRAQLERVGGFIRRRRDIAAAYAQELSNVAGLRLLEWPEGSSYAIYAARLTEPDMRPQVLAAMRQAGVQGDTTLSYVVPALECYRREGYGADGSPHATDWARRVINFPNHPTMTDDEVRRVVHAVRSALAPAAVPGGASCATA